MSEADDHSVNRHLRSITLRLVIGFAALLLLGGALLLLLVMIDYDLSLAALADPAQRSAIWREVVQHVIWPLAIFAGSAAVAVIPAIRLALGPLRLAAQRIEAARGHERGFRLKRAKFPVEVQPFIGSINDLLARLDRAAEVQEAFAADVAHELRSPLAVWSLELDSLPPAPRERLKADVREMQRLIDQLLLLAQIDSATTTTIRRERFELGAVAASVVAGLAPLAIAQGRQLALEVSPTPPGPVHGWREATAAAIRNLVENAIRVTPPGGTVSVVVGPGPTVAVRDGGPGIAAEALTDLVGRRVRGDHASKHGAGLGLAIVQRIMAAHGGTLSSLPARRELVLDFSGAARPGTD